ncbi:MAG: response regulator [Candidatus Thiodiazotropha sp.]
MSQVIANHPCGVPYQTTIQQTMSDIPRPRILFVDSDPNQLQSLEQSLQDLKSRWELVFAQHARSALESIEQEPMDIVVSETQLDGMSGPTLLKEIQSRHPATIRLLFSAETQQSPVREVVHHAHQFITKPCDTQHLIDTLERMIRLGALLENPAIASLVGSLGSLASLPSVYQQLVQALQSDDTTLAEIGRIVSLFGLPRKITSPEQAVSLLGIDTISSLVLGASVFSQLDPQVIEAFELDRLWRHSQAVSSLIRRLGQDMGLSRPQLEIPVMAGLLHDLGKLILASQNGEEYQRIVTQAKTQAIPLYEAEAEALWCHHATIGAYLMGLWGLPLEAVEAVADHHSPDRQSMEQSGKLLVFAANQLYHSIADPEGSGDSALPDGPLMSLLGESVYDRWLKITQEFLDGQTD